jgi:cobalt/nickel transport system permease protein
MSHLHVPDGLLPAWLWGAGLALSLVLLMNATRTATPQQLAYRSALGGLMLAAMAIPLGPLDYHLTLAGPLGVLLGAAGALQVAFIANAILALMGHGGLTTVGLNTLILATAAAVASPSYRWLARRARPALAMALATAAGQVVAGAVWLVVSLVALRVGGPDLAHQAELPGLRWFAGISGVLWVVGILVEAMVGAGLASFLARVHPALLPRPANGTRSMAESPT